jgi:hypothetical protein
MEEFDQRESTRTNHKSRSRNPEFEFEVTVNLSEFSGKPEEEEAQGRKEASSTLMPRNPHGRAPRSPRGAMRGGGSGLSRMEKKLGFEGAGCGHFIASARDSGDPTRVAGRPDGLQMRFG